MIDPSDTEIETITREYCKQLYTYKINNFDENDQFFERHRL